MDQNDQPPARVRRPRGLRATATVLTWLFRVFLRWLVRLRLCRVTITGRENIPASGGAIIACNHLSVSDPVYLWGALRRNMVTVAMAELWSWRMPGVNIMMWLLGHIPVKRKLPASGRRAIDQAVQVVLAGGLLGIFPQGKCLPQLGKLKAGVAHLAQRTGAPLVPVVVVGTDVVKPLGGWRISLRAPVQIIFGSPIDTTQFTGPDAVKKLLAAVRQAMIDLGAVPEPDYQEGSL